MLRAIVALLVTLALVAMAVVFLRPSPPHTTGGGSGAGGGSDGGRLLSIAAKDAAIAPGGRLTVTLPTGSTYVFVSDGSGFAATVTRPGQPVLLWPANAARVRAALQLLADTPTTSAHGVASSSGDGMGSVVGSVVGAVVAVGERTLAFDATPLGGFVTVRVADAGEVAASVEGGVRGVRGVRGVGGVGAVYKVGVSIADLFTDAGLLLWLDAEPMRDAVQATALEFVKAGAGAPRARLVRKGSEWWLAISGNDDPSIPADRAAVAELLGRIASIRAADIDAVADADTPTAGTIAPGGEILLTSGSGQRSSTARLAFVMAGTRARAIASVPGGKAMLTLDGRPETLFFPDPVSLIARTSLARPAADVLRVSISRPSASGTPTVIERVAGTWNKGGAELTATDARALDDILRVLVQTRADVVRIGTPADFVPEAEVALHDLRGSEACRVLVGRAKPPTLPGASESPSVLCIVTASSADQHDATTTITRLYAGKSLPPVIEWLAAQHP